MHTFMSWKQFTHIFYAFYAHFFVAKKITRYFVTKTIYGLGPESFCLFKFAIPKAQTFWASTIHIQQHLLNKAKKFLWYVGWLHGQWHVCPDLPCRQEYIKPSPSSEAKYVIIGDLHEAKYVIIGDLHQPEQHPCYWLVTRVLRCQPGHYIFSYVALHY